VYIKILINAQFDTGYLFVYLPLYEVSLAQTSNTASKDTKMNEQLTDLFQSAKRIEKSDIRADV